MLTRRLAALTWMVLLVACAPKPQAAAPRVATVASPSGAAVAVLPFRTGGQLGADATFSASPGGSGMPDDLGEQAAAVLGARLAAAGIPVVDAATVRRATPVGGAALYDPALAARVATQVGAQFAVIGAITRYVERQGTDWGVSEPATVWYQAALVRASDGGIAERNRFEYTQQPLTANFLELPRFLQGGGRWMTRRQLLEGALGETAQALAKRVR